MRNDLKISLRDISIKTKIFILFIFVLLGTIIATSYIPYSNWRKLANQATQATEDRLTMEITSEIDRFIKETKHLSIVNKGLIEKNIIDINDEKGRDYFFVNALNSFDNESIYSFSYGTELGHYYGARTNENKSIEIMKNNDQTHGHSWYYSAEDGLAKERVLDAGQFDPRTREWYKAAAKGGVSRCFHLFISTLYLMT